MEPVAERSHIFSFLLAIVRDPVLAAEAMRRVVKGEESIRRAREAALSVCRERNREIQLKPASLDALERAASGGLGVQPENLRAALLRLGRQDRSLLAMRYREAFSLERIARRTKDTLAKTQKALHRARTALFLAMGEQTGAGST